MPRWRTRATRKPSTWAKHYRKFGKLHLYLQIAGSNASCVGSIGWIRVAGLENRLYTLNLHKWFPAGARAKLRISWNMYHTLPLTPDQRTCISTLDPVSRTLATTFLIYSNVSKSEETTPVIALVIKLAPFWPRLKMQKNDERPTVSKQTATPAHINMFLRCEW